VIGHLADSKGNGSMILKLIGCENGNKIELHKDE
jgi:hypothetical protein